MSQCDGQIRNFLEKTQMTSEKKTDAKAVKKNRFYRLIIKYLFLNIYSVLIILEQSYKTSKKQLFDGP